MARKPTPQPETPARVRTQPYDPDRDPRIQAKRLAQGLIAAEPPAPAPVETPPEPASE
jgi:hypothetical protein